MAKSQNTTVELTVKGVSYTGMSGKVGQFLVGDKALEFYSDSNVEDYIQMPWENILHIGANVSQNKISRHFEVVTTSGKFLFASSDSGKILKLARDYIGDDKVVRLPTLVQTIVKKIRGLFQK